MWSKKKIQVDIFVFCSVFESDRAVPAHSKAGFIAVPVCISKRSNHFFSYFSLKSIFSPFALII